MEELQRGTFFEQRVDAEKFIEEADVTLLCLRTEEAGFGSRSRHMWYIRTNGPCERRSKVHTHLLMPLFGDPRYSVLAPWSLPFLGYDVR